MLYQHALSAKEASERKRRLINNPTSIGIGTLIRTQELTHLLLSYEDLFTLDSSELGSTNVVAHRIKTGEHPPIRQSVRRTPFPLRTGEMLEQGIGN